MTTEPHAALCPRATTETWLRNLPNASTGYAEYLRPDWSEDPAHAGERTTLTQARLAYTLLHAGALGSASAATAGAELVRTMERYLWDGPRKGWRRSCTIAGEPLDQTIDSYDQAFGLLALAWRYRTAADDSDAAVRASARETALAALDGLHSIADPVNGGFREYRDGDRDSFMVEYPGFRRQNPHMHLLEAFIAWAEADPAGPWAAEARSIIALFRRHFFNAQTATLGEFFTTEWQPAPGAAGARVEPGHHFEWTWLLHRFAVVTGDHSVYTEAEQLFQFAIAHGLDADGFAYEAIDARGRVADPTLLLWPQTEYVKALVARAQWRGEKAGFQVARRVAERFMARFGADPRAPIAGRLQDPGQIAAPTATRLLYHLFIALAELDRA